ncbi:hypothetical protein HBB16_08185 [Pseudonocardia sp. MCCB 268]|nr:hypothetical protein [Pseudonocardia cytotoxica]
MAGDWPELTRRGGAGTRCRGAARLRPGVRDLRRPPRSLLLRPRGRRTPTRSSISTRSTPAGFVDDPRLHPERHCAGFPTLVLASVGVTRWWGELGTGEAVDDRAVAPYVEVEDAPHGFPVRCRPESWHTDGPRSSKSSRPTLPPTAPHPGLWSRARGTLTSPEAVSPRVESVDRPEAFHGLDVLVRILDDPARSSSASCGPT